MKHFFTATLLLTITHLCGQHSILRLPYPVNTKAYDEICPVFDISETTLFYTKVGNPHFNKTLIYNGEDLSATLDAEPYKSKLGEIYRIISGKYSEDPFRSAFNQDVWYAVLDGEDYKVFHPGYPLNDALPNSICSIYGEDDGYVLINQFFELGGMKAGFSTVQLDENKEASFPQPITIRGFNKVSSEINLTMTKDKQIVILAMQAQGQKDKDLFLSVKFNDTLYTAPYKLEGINSSADDTTPFISRDKTRIYFASNREGGGGGFDIYYSERLDYSYKKWSAPKTYNPFLNSSANESHPFITKDGQYMYYTSDRDGSSDIFRADLIRDTLKQMIVIKVNVIKEETGKNFPSEISWQKTFEDEGWPNFWRASKGYHEFTINSNEPIDVKAENRNYKSQVITIDPQELMDKGITEYYLELVLTKDGILRKSKKENKKEQDVAPELELDFQEGKQIVLKNIYFKRAKPDVVPESFGALRVLAKVIKTRPNLIIRVEGHTDNVGDRQALLDLSVARASSIKTFLKSEGVPDYQVEVTGFGGSKPLTDNSTEAHRRKNRRVEIRVVRQ